MMECNFATKVNLLRFPFVSFLGFLLCCLLVFLGFNLCFLWIFLGFLLGFSFVSSRLCYLGFSLVSFWLPSRSPWCFLGIPPFSFLGCHWFFLVALTFVLYYFIPYVLCLCCMGFGFRPMLGKYHFFVISTK